MTVFRPLSDSGLMILPQTFRDVIVEAITYLFILLFLLFFLLFYFFHGNWNFRHNCMPVLGLALTQASPGPYPGLTRASLGPHPGLMRASPGPHEGLTRASPGPHPGTQVNTG